MNKFLNKKSLKSKGEQLVNEYLIELFPKHKFISIRPDS